MDPAIQTLLGVVVGGGITAGANFRLEAVRARREKRSAERQAASSARRSARLLSEELEYVRRLLVGALDRDAFTWEPPARIVPTAAWTEYRADFALVASDDEWAAVAAAFAGLDELNWHVAAVIDEEEWTRTGPTHPLESRTLGPGSRRLITGALAKADVALVQLRGLTSGQAPEHRRDIDPPVPRA